ncbi:phage portal protein [Nocardioides bruguierae]|uniref:Phage portal protein n=1 Tax=Nocardioides bruguierae TaxID=2945102 RepID=A0A9X2D498_9ACTN|nr:phage portal protein [Nocardioides bruguierae]MCM0618770.1 phage portal protein [Nocardioides bruguierae]
MDPLVQMAMEQADSAPAFAVDAESVPPEAYGLTSYAAPVTAVARVGRREAIQVAAVKRSRDLIAGSLGSLPLQVVRSDLRVEPTSWLHQPERDVPRSVTMTRTIEDLLFEGIAWWKVTAFDWRGFPAQVRRLDPRSVDVQKDGRVHVTLDGHRGTADEWPKDGELIRFDSPNDPLLTAGARAIRQCLLLDRAAQRYADGAPPGDYFSAADNTDPFDSEDEVRELLLDPWHQARQARSTAWVPAGVSYHASTFNPEQLELAAQRQHAVLEIARVAGVDPEELGVSTTSRTYANQFDRRKAFLDFTLGGYRAAIEDRLSMGDVTPRGSTVRYDLDAFLRTDPLARYQAYKAGLEVGAIQDQGEVRALEGKPAPTTTVPGSTSGSAPAQETTVTPSMSATEPLTITFDSGPAVVLDAPPAAESFSVDAERRVIRGLAVPYGKTGISNGQRFQFTQGSLKFAETKRVKLWVQHDKNQAIGFATRLEDRADGLYAEFQVARGAEGDRALQLAEDGVLDGLSIGLGRGGRFRDQGGVQFAVDVPLMEISLTPAPSFDDARTGTFENAGQPGQGSGQGAGQGGEAPRFEGLATEIRKAMFQGFSDFGGGREQVSAGHSAGFEVEEPSPYRFDGTRAEHSFVADMRAAQQGDGEARQRLETFGEEFERFAVTTGNVSSLNPTKTRPDLYVPNLQYSRPLWDSVSTGSIEDQTPFTVPKFAAATGLVGAHTQGTEPTPGSFSATVQTITPGATSGKIEINREVLDQGGSPQADQIIWGEMLNAWYEAIEAKIATALAAVATAELNLAGATDAALVDALTGYFAGLQFVRGGNRFTGFVSDGNLFPALVAASDTAGRKLLPVLGPTNAQGSVSGGFDRVQLGTQTIRAAWALGTGNDKKSYSFVPASVWAWASAPRKFVFEYQVKSVDMAIWGYSATAILRDSDVKPIDYTTADA